MSSTTNTAMKWKRQGLYSAAFPLTAGLWRLWNTKTIRGFWAASFTLNLRAGLCSRIRCLRNLSRRRFRIKRASLPLQAVSRGVKGQGAGENENYKNWKCKNRGPAPECIYRGQCPFCFNSRAVCHRGRENNPCCCRKTKGYCSQAQNPAHIQGVL